MKGRVSALLMGLERRREALGELRKATLEFVGIDLHRRCSTIFQTTEGGEVLGTERTLSLGRLRFANRPIGRPFGAGGTAAGLTENRALRTTGICKLRMAAICFDRRR